MNYENLGVLTFYFAGHRVLLCTHAGLELRDISEIFLSSPNAESEPVLKSYGSKSSEQVVLCLLFVVISDFVYVYMYHGVCVEVRGKFVGVTSLCLRSLGIKLRSSGLRGSSAFTS